MIRRLRRGRIALLSLTAFLALCLSSCQGRLSTLEPQSAVAEQIAWLWWVMLGLGTAIFVAVVALLGAALFRRPPEAAPMAAADRQGNLWIVIGGILMPVLVLIAIFAFTVATMRTIEAASPANNTVIEVVGHQWWWEINYPDGQVTTANEIHLPAGQSVTFKLTSRDVIHSAWIPKLHGKFDLTPGRIDTLILQADEAGEYYGQCAEFCGLQHANMGLVVIAETPENFMIWLNAQAELPAPSTEPLVVSGQQVFLNSPCAECHTVQGTEAVGKFGPDLTHLASRLTLASGLLPNTPENLAKWIASPQEIKPGNLMPNSDLTPDELESLLAYLVTLK